MKTIKTLAAGIVGALILATAFVLIVGPYLPWLVALALLLLITTVLLRRGS